MDSGYAELGSADRVVARFLGEYHKIWKANFPGLNKRAHWNVIFAAKTAGGGGVSCRVIHRVLYGSYGTDIRTCIERIKDCERDGFIRIFDDAGRPCAAAAGCSIGGTPKLHQAFDRHCRATIGEVAAVFGDPGRGSGPASRCDEAAVAAIFRFFGAYDQKWRETSEEVVRQKGLTPAYFNDAMDHLVTYQYWAIVMLLWSANPHDSDRGGRPALVIDEIISRMWDVLGLGHLAIKERVANLIRWGFFAEETIKKHKAVLLTPVAAAALSRGLAETKPLLEELYAKLAERPPAPVAARSA
ncbi:MAG TPA: hypothetical protein VGF07_04240 [Stellaceae bacterium]|jgi:hypothetical protein